MAGLVGCYWHRYPDLARTHVEVLTDYSRKLDELVRSGAELRPENLTELRYPYERARDFARIVRDRFSSTESFARFEAFLDRYAELLAAAERVRSGGAAADDAVAPLVRRLEADGEGVIEALAVESR
ncbi:MAG: hypothetical protein ACREQ9_06295 [Candidatus Binatia bacterium]